MPDIFFIWITILLKLQKNQLSKNSFSVKFRQLNLITITLNPDFLYPKANDTEEEKKKTKIHVAVVPGLRNIEVRDKGFGIGQIYI